MAKLTVNAINETGLNPADTLVAADVLGDSVPATDSIFIYASNADVATRTITVAAPVATVSCAGYGNLVVPDLTFSVPTGEERAFRIPQGYAENGVFSWTYDAVTALTVGVFV